MKVIEKPITIEKDDSFKMILSKYGALALDKQENLSELIGDAEGDLDIEKGIIAFGDIEFPVLPGLPQLSSLQKLRELP